MKKLIIFSFLAVALMAGCNEKDIIDNATQVGVSKITHYITYTLTGGSTVVFPKGSGYVDPGYVALEGTVDVTTKVTVSGDVNGNKVGLYTLTYTAVNADGFSSSTQRTVIIYDPAAPSTDISGNYLSHVARISPGRTFTGLKVTIEKLAPGFFHVSDFIGGFYDQGANYKYGPAYAFSGYMQVNADNTLTLVSSFSSAWAGQGDNGSLADFQNAIYNPGTNNLSWDAIWDTGTGSVYDFQVTLVKQ
jgi:hypothetical protein